MSPGVAIIHGKVIATKIANVVPPIQVIGIFKAAIGTAITTAIP